MTPRTVLQLRQAPPLRLDARALLPGALAALAVPAIEALPLRQGRDTVALGEFFTVRRDEADSPVPELHLEGDCSRLDQLGWGLDHGLLHVHCRAGHAAGGTMRGGRLQIDGDAGDLAGVAMAGGWLEIAGNCGDFAAAALPGEMDGMHGGTLVVRGHAGARLADRMRRGRVVVHGDAGDWLAARMVAGTVALGGRCGAHPACGMRRGSLVFAGDAPAALPPTFVPVAADVAVAWQLLARDLARHGGRFTALPGRAPQRLAGDLAVQGQGELLMAG